MCIRMFSQPNVPAVVLFLRHVAVTCFLLCPHGIGSHFFYILNHTERTYQLHCVTGTGAEIKFSTPLMFPVC